MATEGMHQEAVKCTITCNLQGEKKKKNLIKIDIYRGGNYLECVKAGTRTQKKLVIQHFTTNNNSTRGKY